MGPRTLPLTVSDIKQIAGRAGRYRTSNQDTHPGTANQRSGQTSVGLITTMYAHDLPLVQRAMQTIPEPITTAGISPPDHVIQNFSAYFPPETPLSVILRRLVELCETQSLFHLCEIQDALDVADIIHEWPELSVTERLTFCAAPVSFRDPSVQELVKSFARCVAQQRGGTLPDIRELDLEILDFESSPNKEYLKRLESLHRGIILYLWFSYRFDHIFTDRDMAMHVKRMTQDRIASVLDRLSQAEGPRRQRERRQRMSVAQALLFANLPVPPPAQAQAQVQA